MIDYTLAIHPHPEKLSNINEKDFIHSASWVVHNHELLPVNGSV
jgi:hypothetical protein